MDWVNNELPKVIRLQILKEELERYKQFAFQAKSRYNVHFKLHPDDTTTLENLKEQLKHHVSAAEIVAADIKALEAESDGE